GIAGLIKTALALKHGAIPASLHFSEPNPLIAWDDLRLAVPTTLTPWPAGARRRTAGGSAFGLSGSNAHTALQEYVREGAPSSAPPERPLHVLTAGGSTAKGLDASIERLRSFLQSGPDASIADICFSANAGRGRFLHRAAVVARDAPEAARKLGA